MKQFTIVLLLVCCLGNTAAFAELTLAEYKQMQNIVATSNEELWQRMEEYIDSKIEVIRTEIKVLRTEIKVLRTEIEVLRTEIREMGKRQTAENQGQTERLTDHRNLLIVLITSVIGSMTVFMTVILFFLKKLWDKHDAQGTQISAQIDEIRALREENAAVRAENERLKPQIVLTDKG